MLRAAKASKHLGLTAHPTFSGALAWPYLYPWPQRAPGLIETAFEELARRWKPILNAFDDAGVDVAYEIHPCEDLFDGTSFERFLDAVKGHKRCHDQLRSVALRPAAARLSRLHRHLPRADLRISCQGRRVQPDRAPGRLFGLCAVDRAGWTVPLARRRAGRFLGRLLQDGAIRLFVLGGARMGMLPQASRRTARARAPSSSSVTSSGSPTKAFDDFAGGAIDKKQIKRALGLR